MLFPLENLDKPVTWRDLLIPKVKFFCLPGGKLPERQTGGAAGWDGFARAVVSAHEMEPTNNRLRKTLFDFTEQTADPENRHHVHTHGKWHYRLFPGERVVVGLGFITEMPPPLMYWVCPRSGLSSKYGVNLANSPGTVDADYRGEAGANLWNTNPVGHDYLDFTSDSRIVQVLFGWAAMPQISVVETFEELSSTLRGSGGFGSTGVSGSRTQAHAT